MAGLTIETPTTQFDLDSALRIKTLQLQRSKQILALAQARGKFPREEYDTFITYRGAYRKRDLATIRPEYMELGGKIVFINRDDNVVAEATEYFYVRFTQLAPRYSGNKNHSYKYAQSNAAYLNDTKIPASALAQRLDKKTFERQDRLRLINVAPHAATMEYQVTGGVFYKIAKEIRQTYGPRISIIFNYLNSDAIGVTYTKGTGGPAHKNRVYALPQIILGAPGAFSSSISTPRRRRKGNHRRRRVRV